MEKAICYARTGPAEQGYAGLSIREQTDRLLRYCAENTLDPMMVIRDENVSGVEVLDNRLGGRDLLRLLSAAGVRHVVTLRLDRLFRNVHETFNRVKGWLDGGIHLHVVDMGGFPVRTDGEGGERFLGILAGVIEMERNQVSERTSRLLARKKANRFAYGATPYGYDQTGNQLMPNPRELAVIRRVKQWREAGWSLRRIAQTLNEEGIPTKRSTKAPTRWYASTVRYLLTNPLYDQEK